ncbi:MAG: right-handed parallel beta-helix repeat-containing protein [Phycisphaerales bacterium]|nr:MAG: right-handed parallel beta-helix repeat-containing protein [Phycisphaerales bacterium]
MLRARANDRNDRIAVITFTIAVLVLATTTSIAHAGTVLYVDDDAPLGGDGQSWNTAYRYLQDALAAAQPGSGVEEIHVGQGTHKPDQDEGGNVTPGDREASFELTDGVALMGGYAGFGAPDPDERDVTLYETVLSGDLLDDDADPYENMGDNSGHVLKGFGLGQTTSLDGFTVTRGFAEEDQIEDEWAAGLWLEDSDLVIVDCTFLQNVSDGSAGGVGILNGSPSVEHCRFEGNRANEWEYLNFGGGLAAFSDDMLTMTHCVFEGNASTQGGGANVQAPAVISSCSFRDNYSGGYSGGLALIQADITVRDCQFVDNFAYHRGGGIACAYEGQFVISDCHFSGNDADHHGVAIAIEDGAQARMSNCRFEDNSSTNYDCVAVYLDDEALVNVVNCDFIANTDGGVLVLDSQGVLFTSCRFLGNEAEDGTGGLTVGDIHSSVALTNCLFSGNVGAYGAAVRCWEGELRMSNCAVVGNSASEEAGGLLVVRGTVNIVNSIFWGNSDNTGVTESAQITLADDDSVANVTSCCIQELDQYAGPGNIGDDPLFLDPDGTDDIVGTEDDDLHILAGSPCIDAGDNAVVGLCSLDLDRQIRRADDPNTPDTGFGDPPIVDMGVFEVESYTAPDCNFNALDDDCEIAEGLVEDCNGNGVPDECDIADGFSDDLNNNGIPDECECPADLNNDGKVNIDDLFQILGAWGTCDECPEDLNGDGKVNIDDLFIILGEWGPCP